MNWITALSALLLSKFLTEVLLSFVFFFFLFLVFNISLKYHCLVQMKFKNQNLRTTTRNHKEKVFKEPILIWWKPCSDCLLQKPYTWSPSKETVTPTLPPALPRQISSWAFGPRVPQQSSGIPCDYWTDMASLQSNPECSRNQNFRTSWLPDKAGWTSSHSWIHTRENELVSKLLTSIL